jgi:hypothetical protein
MITKETTLLGQQVTLGYCYASEISYKLLAEEELSPFLNSVREFIAKKQEVIPDARKTIFAILAATNAYYESKGEECPISDKQLMYDATPDELGAALGMLLLAWAEFYKLMPGAEEKKPKKKAGKGKNS